MISAKNTTNENHDAITGGLYATLAFLIWGSFPVYFKLVEAVPVLELLSHRITWSAVLPVVALLFYQKRQMVQKTWRNRKRIKALCCSSLMIAGNWYLFIWAATNDHVLDSSLGYFIAPLLSVLLGVVVLGERLRTMQWIALFLAGLGVALLVYRYGQVPWIAILIATTFSLYSLIRKVANVDPITGLLFETTMILPFSLGYLFYLGFSGAGSFISAGANFSLLLMGTGLISTLPLLFYISGAKRLRLATMGFFQFILPTCHFVLAVWVYKEPFSYAQLSTFVLIWIALVIYSFDVYRQQSDSDLFLGEKKFG